jgi:hypothetical protein
MISKKNPIVVANSVKWFTAAFVVASLMMVLPPAYAETLIRDAQCRFIGTTTDVWDVSGTYVDTETYNQPMARGWEVIGPDGQIIVREIIHPAGEVFENGVSIAAHVRQAGQYTINGYTNDPNTDPFEGEKGSATVTCIPPLTDLFKNQGECVKFATSHRDSGITKAACKNAFP